MREFWSEILASSGRSFRPAANHSSSADITTSICSDSRFPRGKVHTYADGLDHARCTYPDFLRGTSSLRCLNPVGIRYQRGGSDLLVQSRKEEQRDGRDCC